MTLTVKAKRYDTYEEEAKELNQFIIDALGYHPTWIVFEEVGVWHAPYDITAIQFILDKYGELTFYWLDDHTVNRETWLEFADMVENDYEWEILKRNETLPPPMTCPHCEGWLIGCEDQG
jgi:hypothetical protein